MQRIFFILTCLLSVHLPAQAQPVVPQAATNPAAAPAPGFATPPMAQPVAGAVPEISSIEVQKAGKAGRDVYIGSYITVDRTCKVGPTPKVEFTTQPKNGKLRTLPDAMNLTQAPGIPRNKCLGVSPTGIAIRYRSNPRFKGDDTFVYMVTYPDGRQREVKGTVAVQ